MKKNFLLAVLFIVASCRLFSQDVISIIGTGFDSYKEVTLKVYNFEKLGYEALDEIRLGENGDFSFKTDFIEANLYELNFDEKDFVHLSITEGGSIEVIRNEATTVIKGSPSSQSILDFQRKNTELQAKYFGQLKADMDQAMQEENEARINELQQEAEKAIQQFLIEFRSLIVSMSTTPAAFYALQYSDFNKELDFIESRLEAFKSEAPATIVTKSLERLVYKAKFTAIGKTPPDFTAIDLEGNEVSLNYFKGKVLLIDFWAYWCRACRIENPKFAKIYEDYENKGFHILSISEEVEQLQLENAIIKDGIKAFQHIMDTGNEIFDLYSISSLPQNLLLDQSGKIIAKNISAEELEKLLKNMW